MIYKMILLIGLTLVINGCFRSASALEILIIDTTQQEYEQIKKNVKNIVTNLKPSFDCDSDNETWGDNRKDGELICNNASLYMEFKNNFTSINLNTTTPFWIPTKEKVSDFHEKMRKLFIKMARKYKKKYPNSTVKVIFYHHDLPKDGKIIYGENDK